MNQDTPLTRTGLTTPRAAAIAGIIFSVLLITILVLIRISVPKNPADAGEWLTRGWKTVELALNLLPFAGIAFLWFIGVIRDRLGSREDRFFASVFLGSGLLFLSTLFACGAIAAGVISLFGATPGMLIESGVYAYGRVVAYELMNVYTMRMAGVFMISTCTLSLRTGIIPRWMAFLGFALALFLLLSMSFISWALLVFPLWILLISVYILWENFKSTKRAQLEQANSA